MILEKVIDIIADELCVSPNELDADTDLRENLGIDSLDEVGFIWSLEDEFGIEIPDSKAQTFRTIGDIASFIEKEL